MKPYITIIFSILIFNFSSAQQTTEYNDFVNQFKIVDSKPLINYWKNGNLQFKTTENTYEYNKEIFNTYSGELNWYHENGQISFEGLVDQYGKLMYLKTYDEDGNITGESIVTKIDSRARSVTEFINPGKGVISKVVKVKHYRFSKKLGANYLHQEGVTISGKKRGLWKTYTKEGKLKKEKIY